ncbi:histidine kinase [Legionella sp. WA2022007384]
MKIPIQKNSQMKELLNLIHDLNQPLTAIKAYLGGCELRLQKNDLHPKQMLGVLQKINEHTELLKSKIEFMKELSTQERLLEDSIDLQNIITEIISLYSYEIEQHNIKLTLNFQKNFSDFHINQFQVKQVLFRLLKQCINTIEKNKIPEAKLEIQTHKEKNAAKIIIKSNFLIREEDVESELIYCRTLLNKDNDNLLAELFMDASCFQLILTKGNGYAF